MKKLFTIFVLLFASSVVADLGKIYPYIFDVKDSSKYPYKEKNALEERRSELAGRDARWLKLCNVTSKEHAIWTKRQVKKLSTPDYKLFMKGFNKKAKKRSCASDITFMKRNSKYIANLQAKIDLRFGLIESPPYYCCRFDYCKSPTSSKTITIPKNSEPFYIRNSLSSNPCGKNKQINKNEYSKLFKEHKEKRNAATIKKLKKLSEKEKFEEEKNKQENIFDP